ncbi:GNAT family N-acetyltransferase [Longimicrobium sp.]|uniref:GNAT family N-acetyltransferase n=1 Tax=Longimicrobium sp. TaxID=2029185 RepID=UPI002BC739D6|nr:GNAT family N-acetyltransferase [Longimicrobium sp.]HSU17732.1 GNAT family N-acetyltransferase [Longimicrobium sp.]
MTVVETERLVLREFTPEDAEFILRLLNEPSFIANIADRGVRTTDDAAAYLTDGPIRSYAAHGHGLWLVALKEAGMQPIGMCGLLRREQFEDVDLGYAFLPEFWSRGFAFEAAAAVLEYGKRSLGLARAIALVAPHNAGSIRLLEKLGFAFSSHVQMKPGAPDTAVYELPSL